MNRMQKHLLMLPHGQQRRRLQLQIGLKQLLHLLICQGNKTDHREHNQ